MSNAGPAEPPGSPTRLLHGLPSRVRSLALAVGLALGSWSTRAARRAGASSGTETLGAAYGLVPEKPCAPDHTTSSAPTSGWLGGALLVPTADDRAETR